MNGVLNVTVFEVLEPHKIRESPKLAPPPLELDYTASSSGTQLVNIPINSSKLITRTK